jgi:hypothetical protein
MGEKTEKQTAEQQKTAEQQSTKATINLQALAEKVYALLQNELRIEQERLGRR